MLSTRIWTVLKSQILNIFKSLKVLNIVGQEKKGSSLFLRVIESES